MISVIHTELSYRAVLKPPVYLLPGEGENGCFITVTKTLESPAVPFGKTHDRSKSGLIGGKFEEICGIFVYYVRNAVVIMPFRFRANDGCAG
jgi:hypothetical protein